MKPSLSSREAPHTVSRRDFLQRTCGAVLAAGLAGSATALSGCDSVTMEGIPDGVALVGNTVAIDLTRTPSLSRSDGFLWIPDADTIVIHDDQVGYRAFSSICPHKQKQVESFDGSELRCPAHGWTFGVDGKRAAGGDLDQFPLSQDGDILTIDVS